MPNWVKNITDYMAAVKTQTDKLKGNAPIESAVSANWQSGVATSGEVGADLVVLGVDGSRKKLHSLVVGVAALTAGAKVSIRMYKTVNGVEQKIYPPMPQTFTIGTVAPGIWVVNGTVEIDQSVRVECCSDTPADNGRAITYSIDLEDM